MLRFHPEGEAMRSPVYTFTAIALSSVVICGCAARPESIAPAYVSTLNYSNLTCPQLAEENARVSSAYVTAAAEQKHARKTDTMGVIFLGLPVGSMTGENVAPQVANLKGEANAIHEVETQKNCSAPPALPADAHPYLATPSAATSK
jgi:hypothetical protein